MSSCPPASDAVSSCPPVRLSGDAVSSCPPVRWRRVFLSTCPVTLCLPVRLSGHAVSSCPPVHLSSDAVPSCPPVRSCCVFLSACPVTLCLVTDCSGVPDIHPDRLPADGVYVIRPGGADHSRRVLCQFERLADGGTAAWTVIQRRVDAAVLFDRTWAEYGSGFGRLDSDFWLGNAALHQLTRRAAHRLRVEMRSTGGATWWAEYDHFGVAAESADYRLSVTGYRGNATDALRYSDGAAFSTSDADHDSSSTHCARLYAAGWWYRHCHYGNLNGRYAVGIVWFNQDVDEWMQMRQTVMKIRVAPPGGGNVTNAIGGKGGEEGGG